MQQETRRIQEKGEQELHEQLPVATNKLNGENGALQRRSISA
jgi:hypothetical protein